MTVDLDRFLRTRLAASRGISRVLPPELESDWPTALQVLVQIDRFEGETLAGGLNRAMIDATW